jgi:hypothetical protein
MTVSRIYTVTTLGNADGRKKRLVRATPRTACSTCSTAGC